MVIAESCHIVIGTSIIAIGVDLAAIQVVVIYRDPQDLDELLQMVGRIQVLYNPGNDTRGEAYIYLNVKSKEQAEKAIEEANTKAKGGSKVSCADNDHRMDLTIAKFEAINQL
jgi:CRISPR/Cas system-associated endonuclease/helicase Cas3